MTNSYFACSQILRERLLRVAQTMTSFEGIDSMRSFSKTSLYATLTMLLVTIAADSVLAQTDRRRRDDATTTKSLESRVEKAEESLVEEYKEVASEFYKQGDREKAVALLQRLSSLNPTMPGLKDQIKTIQQELLEDNLGDIAFDTRKQVWLPVGRVQRGKAVRLQCTGEYKMTLSTTLSSNGMQKMVTPTPEAPPRRRGNRGNNGANGNSKTQKPKRTEEDISFVENLPLGCLAGVIVNGTELGDPFQISGATTLTPATDGILIIKTNLPPGCRCTGKLKLVFSGHIDTDAKK